jgi:hypothetical protein
VTLEVPPQDVLESFRVAKAALFTTKTRTAMDQLEPVLRTNCTSMDFRDAFERKLRFVLEFGLANLFPNMGSPRRQPSCASCFVNAGRRRGSGEGTMSRPYFHCNLPKSRRTYYSLRERF